MKARSLLLFFLIIAAISSCTKALHCTASAGGDTVEFIYRLPTQVFPCVGNMQATVTAINDSRCPKDVVCVWAGEVRATLAMGDFDITLLKDHPRDTIYKQHKLRFRLIDVTPYPGSTTGTATDRKVIVSITRL